MNFLRPETTTEKFLKERLKTYYNLVKSLVEKVVFSIFIKMGVEKNEIFLFLDRDPESKYHLRGF
jgi:hypothetical protein